MSVNAQLITILTALVLVAATARVILGAVPITGTATVYAAVKLGPHPDGWGVRVELAAK
jgi:hypothetical protein